MLGFSCLFTTALLMSSSDPSLQQSTCSKSVQIFCEGGYLGALVRKPRLFNPLDWCLLRLSAHFPLDLFFLAAMLLYAMVSTLFGLSTRGVRCGCLSLMQFAPGETSSIGAIIMTAIVIFISLANTVQLPTLAPNYVGFGSHATECEGPGAVAQRCDRSRLSAMLIRMTTGFEIFSHVFYASSWLFGLTALWSAAYAGCCAKKQANLRVESFEDEPTDHLDSNEGQVLMGLMGEMDEDDFSDDDLSYSRDRIEDDY